MTFVDRSMMDLPTIHELKCWPYFYQQIRDGLKTFEIRFDDRGYRTGDILYIREYDKNVEQYTTHELYRRITYISDFQQQPGYVVLALEVYPLPDQTVEPPKGLMEKLTEAAIGAKLPAHYHWGADAMESFDFGKHRACIAVRKAFCEYFGLKNEGEVK